MATMRHFFLLTGRRRTPSLNRMLGSVLAFNAGAINAGGFLVAKMYTSHMTGFTAMVADNLITGQMTLVLSAIGALLSFTCGAACTAIMVNWARQRGLRSEYALPLLLAAFLMLVFGLIGATLNNKQTPFAMPLTVLVLAFTMGLQNALVTKLSNAQIRTTHMTGVITDIGIELGKMFYWNRTNSPPESYVRANHVKLRLFSSLLGMFVLGSFVGAAGFNYLGFIWTVPQATLLLLLCLPPLFSDLRRILLRKERQRRFNS